jgi:predicted dinucleotide-binding enzyme
MSSSTPSLSIAIIGVGRIGSSFAYQLAGAGHDVIVVARPGSRLPCAARARRRHRLDDGGKGDGYEHRPPRHAEGI